MAVTWNVLDLKVVKSERGLESLKNTSENLKRKAGSFCTTSVPRACCADGIESVRNRVSAVVLWASRHKPAHVRASLSPR